MKPKLVNRAWKFLPYEYKAFVHHIYNHPDCNDSDKRVFENLFGINNLTSDIVPLGSIDLEAEIDEYVQEHGVFEADCSAIRKAVEFGVKLAKDINND